jgi:hypothetical protein
MLINFQLRRLKLGSSRNYHISKGISTGFSSGVGSGGEDAGEVLVGGIAFFPNFSVRNLLTFKIGPEILLAYANNFLS